MRTRLTVVVLQALLISQGLVTVGGATPARASGAAEQPATPPQLLARWDTRSDAWRTAAAWRFAFA